VIDTNHVEPLKNEGPAGLQQLAPQADGDQTVIDDLPMYVPVTPRELDVIEMHLQSFLDEFLHDKCRSYRPKTDIEGYPRDHFKRNDS
jgi:hypothetical protein